MKGDEDDLCQHPSQEQTILHPEKINQNSPFQENPHTTSHSPIQLFNSQTHRVINLSLVLTNGLFSDKELIPEKQTRIRTRNSFSEALIFHYNFTIREFDNFLVYWLRLELKNI